MTIPPVTHPFIPHPKPEYKTCVRCGLLVTHPVHGPMPSTSVDERGVTTTSQKDGW